MDILSNISLFAAESNNLARIVITALIVVLLGAGIAFFAVRKKMPKKKFSVLSEAQITLDKLDGAAIFRWAKEAGNRPDVQRVVAYANKRWISKLGYEYPPEIDSQHNVIAFSVNTVTGESSAEQLFSFVEMTDQVKNLFGKEDCFFLKD